MSENDAQTRDQGARRGRDYTSQEWLELRIRILARDGHCCRNCGSGTELEVHHWLPPAEFKAAVDEFGYAIEGNPLIVHESGLVALCGACHAVLTSMRKERFALNDPQLRKLGRGAELHNVFEIWALLGKTTPFKVVKDSWSRKVRQYYLVEKVEIGKWPYGSAWGRYVRDGEAADYGKVPNAGTYTWIIVADDGGEGESC